MICIGCKYYDDSVDCCNADENCYRVGYQQGRSDAVDEMVELLRITHKTIDEIAEEVKHGSV